MGNFEYSRKIFEGHFRDLNIVNNINNPLIMKIALGNSLFSMIYSRNIL